VREAAVFDELGGSDWRWVSSPPPLDCTFNAGCPIHLNKGKQDELDLENRRSDRTRSARGWVQTVWLVVVDRRYLVSLAGGPFMVYERCDSDARVSVVTVSEQLYTST